MSWVACKFIFVLFLVGQTDAPSEALPSMDVPFEWSVEDVEFVFEDKEFVFKVDYGEPTRFSIANKGQVVFVGTLCSEVRVGYFAGLTTLDVDGNGFRDFVFKNYLVGGSGATSTIVRYNVFMFFPEDKVRYVDVSTFRVGDGAFVDLNGDGSYEFISCKTIIQVDASRYILKNVYSLSVDGISNVTDLYPSFLGAFQFVDESKKLGTVKVEYSDNVFSSPVFWREACDKQNW